MTYNSDGITSISQESGERVPWTKTITVKDEPLTIAQVSGQNQGETGTVKCSITVDGKMVKEGTAKGAYAIASCDASL